MEDLRNLDTEFQAIYDIVSPYVSREHIRKHLKIDVEDELETFIHQIIDEVYNKK